MRLIDFLNVIGGGGRSLSSFFAFASRVGDGVGMGRTFSRTYAPSTLGSFLRAFAFRHVRQLDVAASRFFPALAGLTFTAPGIDAYLPYTDTIGFVGKRR
ncbi:MAG: hypothetical protein ACOYD0_08300 [Candidatus Nanopelagicales bacterium]